MLTTVAPDEAGAAVALGACVGERVALGVLLISLVAVGTFKVALGTSSTGVWVFSPEVSEAAAVTAITATQHVAIKPVTFLTERFFSTVLFVLSFENIF